MSGKTTPLYVVCSPVGVAERLWYRDCSPSFTSSVTDLWRHSTYATKGPNWRTICRI